MHSSATTEIRPAKMLQHFAWLYLAAAAAYQIAIVFAPLEFVVREMTVDDTYLYLNIAVNWAQCGLPTFDGTTPTNGFQPLWQVVLVGLAGVVQDRELLVRLACLLSALLNVATAPLILRLGTELADRTVGLVAMIGWAAFLFTPRGANGMESSLHGLIFAFTALVVLRTWRQLPDVSAPRMLGVGALLSLNGLCRLDSGLISAAVAGLLALKLIRAKHLQIACLALIPLVSLSGYLAWNKLSFGTATPVSGKTKIFWAHAAVERGPAEIAAGTLEGAARTLSHAFMDVSGGGLVYSYPWLPILAVLMAAALARAWMTGKLDRRLIVWGCIMAAHVLLLHLLLQQLGKAYWYYQPLRVLAAVAVGHLAWLQWPRLPVGAQRAVAAAVLLAACTMGMVRGLERYANRHHYAGDEEIRVQMLHAARWLAGTDQLPAGARLGAWNAGALGYYGSPRTVVNLDGLVQSSDFLSNVLQKGAWKEYLRQASIDYLIDYNHSDSTLTYRREWDRAHVFRDLVPFSEVTVVHQVGPVLVLDIRDWLAADDP